MILVGIDVAKHAFVAAAIDSRSEVVLSPCSFDQSAEGFAAFGEVLKSPSAEPGGILIGMEASGHYGHSLWQRLRNDGWRVDAFNPLVAKSGNVRGRKTDKDDALAIARRLRDQDYSAMQPASPDHQTVKSLSRQRRWLVESLADAKRRLRSLVDQTFPELDGFFSDLFGAAPMALLAEAPSAAAVAEMNLTRMGNLLGKASRNRVTRERAEKIRAAARKSIAASFREPGTEWAIRQMVNEIRRLSEQVALVEKEIDATMVRLDPPIRSIPGVGAVTAAVIVSELGDLDRFDANPKKVLAYAGLDPRVSESGQWRGVPKMTKRGSRYLRTALFQAANMVRLNQPTFAAIYDKHRRIKGKHHRVAISHVARHLIQILCSMHRHNTTFEVDKLCFQTP